MDRKTFNAGEVIFSLGEESDKAYRILSGRVEISINTADGSQSVGQLHEGEVFGEMGLVDEKPRSATATALDLTEVEVITEENFMDTILGDPERTVRYLGTLFERLRTADTLLEMAGSSSSLETALHEAHAAEGGTSAGPETATDITVFLQSNYDASGWRGDRVEMQVAKFPFRIGRQYFGPAPGATPFAMNDLSLRDDHPPVISRHHCAIERKGNTFVVRDRGSSAGTSVNGRVIGLKAGVLTADLNPGENVLVLGGTNSPHRFFVFIQPAG